MGHEHKHNTELKNMRNYRNYMNLFLPNCAIMVTCFCIFIGLILIYYIQQLMSDRLMVSSDILAVFAMVQNSDTLLNTLENVLKMSINTKQYGRGHYVH